ncbi:hypothetical protein CARUB_v10015819mg [Capsella rubella]|uniref:Uncharacterized protein n=1 Tax=Capsella rubella TaxID=81985 RepID=R0G2K7_9BRAS|nr:uncharacterized protein At4g14450, chloroplastic [Capsella rubella]EOA29672.1 hypothetical protein CARUB_v10015819mg [Capsella rubella]
MSTTMKRPGCSSDSGDRRRQSSRLKKRPPALNIVPATPAANNWKTAIPLLSPLALSPETSLSPVDEDQQPPAENQKATTAAVEKTLVFEKWQHPAAPFYYESSTFVPPFVPV